MEVFRHYKNVIGMWLLSRAGSMRELTLLFFGIVLSCWLTSLAYDHYCFMKQNLQEVQRTQFQENVDAVAKELDELLAQTQHDLAISAQHCATVWHEQTAAQQIAHQFLEQHPDATSFLMIKAPFSQQSDVLMLVQRRHTIEQKMLPDDYNFSDAHRWFSQAMNDGMHGLWFGPLVDFGFDKPVLCYAVPVHLNEKEKPVGVIVATYRLNTFIEMLDALDVPPGGDVVMLADSGIVLHSKQQPTWTGRFLQDVLDLKPGFPEDLLSTYFRATGTEASDFVIPAQMPTSDWMIGFRVLANQHLVFASEMQHAVGALLLAFLLLMLFVGFFFSYLIFFRAAVPVTPMLSWYVIAVLLCAVSMWYVKFKVHWTATPDELVMSSRAQVARVFNTLRRRAQINNQQAPIGIKTGIVINNLELIGQHQLNVLAKVWQRYDHRKYPTYKPSITLAKMIDLECKEISRKVTDDETFITWQVKGKRHFKTNSTIFPFNKRHMTLKLMVSNQDVPVVPLPDFKTYESLKKGIYPWLDPEVVLPGLNLDDVYLSFKKERELGVSNDVYKLQLHLVAYHNIVYTILMYLLPIFVIIVSLFALLWLEIEKSLVSYSTLFFGTILLHSGFRTYLRVNEFVYLELLFLSVYCTLLFLLTTSIISSYKHMKILAGGTWWYWTIIRWYWPAQVTVWLITTLLLFYR